MQHNTEQFAGREVADEDAPGWTAAVHRRVIVSVIAVLCLLLLVVVPPYISVSRYQRRVAAAIAGALGRPVHFDSISLQLLPVPGLTIQNFTVSEDEAFGAEPILRANTVTARLRLASLWRRRIEVSRISLDAPSINLVHGPVDGRWNLQGVLQQASQLNSAPTAQARPSDAPRFPYIEATGARINFKSGIDKLPFSIRETDFSLWLPQPDQWHLRLSGRPVRTDTDVSDVGLVRVEATLGRAADLGRAPIDLSASWKRTPLGEAAKLTAGYDLGWRGDVSAETTLRGTVGDAKLTTDLHLLGLRRADYFPEHPMEVQAHCEAVASGILRSANDVRCAVPTTDDTSFFSMIGSLGSAPNVHDDAPDGVGEPGVLLLRGEVPNLLYWRTISGTASLSGASPAYALAWMRLFSRRIPRELNVGGTFDLSLSTAAAGHSAKQWEGRVTCECILPESTPPGGTSAAAAGEHGQGVAVAGKKQTEDVGSTGSMGVAGPWLVNLRHDGADAGTAADALSIAAYPWAATAKDASPGGERKRSGTAAVSGQIGPSGYVLTYDSWETAQGIAALLPATGDGLPLEGAGEFQVQHIWNGAVTWTTAKPSVARSERHHRRRR